MSLKIRCPNKACRAIHAVKEQFAGMRAKCPRCGSVMRIPRPGELQARKKKPAEVPSPTPAPSEPMEPITWDASPDSAPIVEMPPITVSDLAVTPEERWLDVDGPGSLPARMRFSRVPILALCVAGMLLLIGSIGPLLSWPEGVTDEDQRRVLMGLPALTAILALGAAFLALRRKKYRFGTTLLGGLALALSILILIAAGKIILAGSAWGLWLCAMGAAAASSMISFALWKIKRL